MLHRRQRILLTGVGRVWRVIFAMCGPMPESRYVRNIYLLGRRGCAMKIGPVGSARRRVDSGTQDHTCMAVRVDRRTWMGRVSIWGSACRWRMPALIQPSLGSVENSPATSSKLEHPNHHPPQSRPALRQWQGGGRGGEGGLSIPFIDRRPRIDAFLKAEARQKPA